MKLRSLPAWSVGGRRACLHQLVRSDLQPRERLRRACERDFNWQLSYELKAPLKLPKGARIDCVAHDDNSINNKHNPDPTKEVTWGDQTWEEMTIGRFDYTAPAAPATVAAR